MLIVNSKKTVFNLNNISKIEIKLWGREYAIQSNEGIIEIIDESSDHRTNYNKAAEILQDILDAYSKGLKVFYTDGRIV